jgi:hypothetical protein
MIPAPTHIDQPDAVFTLIGLSIKLLMLPFKLIFELMELLAHAQHRNRRRRHR